jgi:hypothetical protein
LLLPDGGEEIEWAAKRFVESVSAAAVGKLDRALQDLVLEPRGGLFGACQKAGDFIQELAGPLVDQTSAYLGTLLPVNDVAELTDRRGTDWANRLKKAFDRAAPTISGSGDREKWYLLVPETPGGQKIAALAAVDFPGATVHAASHSNEVTFCRVQRLRSADVREAMQYCREPYEERASRPAPSPHARFDVMEWLPLDI